MAKKYDSSVDAVSKDEDGKKHKKVLDSAGGEAEEQPKKKKRVKTEED